MGTTRKPNGLDSARALLQRSDAPVHYDVSLGLARHQQRVARGAPLPAWAAELEPAAGNELATTGGRRSLRALARRAWWLGSALVVVGALWLGLRGAEPVEPTARVDSTLSGPASQRSAAVVSAPSTGVGPAERAAKAIETPGGAAAPRWASRPTVERASETAAGPLDPPAGDRPARTAGIAVVTPPADFEASSRAPAQGMARGGARSASAPASTIDTSSQPAPRAADAQGAHGALRPSETATADHPSAPSARRKARVRAESPRDAEEMRQLVEAERLLTAEPVRALRIVREGQVTFRGGYFAQERRYIEVMALFALGRRGEAHARATWFLRDYPSGPYRHRVESEMARLPAH